MQAVQQDAAVKAQQKAAKALSAAKLKAVDTLLWGHKQSQKPGEAFHTSSSLPVQVLMLFAIMLKSDFWL